MEYKTFIPGVSLQLFAEGGAAAPGAGDGGTAQGQGVTEAAALPQSKGAKNPLANVKYGIQEDQAPDAGVQETAAAPADRSAAFENLIKGEYKDLYDAKIQDIIQKRLKSTKQTVEKFQAATPLLEMLAGKYGVRDASDIQALTKAIEDDNSFWEQEAMERGMSVEDLKTVKKMEKENASLKKQMQDNERREKADRLYKTWLQQEQETKKVYPTFDMKKEMQNEKFVQLLQSNIDVRTAYEVLHKDDIIRGAMQFTAKTVEQKVANKIAANGARPTENGMSSQGAAVVKSDVSQLSKADREEIIRRVQRGEKIRF